MGIAFQDFLPATIQSQGAFGPVNSYSTTDELVKWANGWIEAQGADVVNVETLVLPNAKREGVIEAERGHFPEGDYKTNWFQVVRVWYRT